MNEKLNPGIDALIRRVEKMETIVALIQKQLKTSSKR